MLSLSCLISSCMFVHRVIATIDNHSTGYLGLAVQLYVRAYLGSHCILVQKRYCQNLVAQLLNSTALIT